MGLVSRFSKGSPREKFAVVILWSVMLEIVAGLVVLYVHLSPDERLGMVWVVFGTTTLTGIIWAGRVLWDWGEDW